ncbi:DUF4253 domain-containing protein [Kitasatospora sp. NPDC096147]|uniref:DUF4253 domain-containing protein n=1 Tax=Kitasatospora sp. NPDC096147 TaxID=3364093 RepID=UPI0038250ACF
MIESLPPLPSWLHPSATGSAVTDAGLTVHGLLLERQQADRAWRHLLALHPETGWYPFLSSRPADPRSWRRHGSPDRIWHHLDHAASLDATALLDEYVTRAGDAPIELPWPPVDRGPSSRMPDGPYWLLLVPAAAGHELPVLLDPLVTGFTDFRDVSIPAEHHAAVLRDWHRRFGAEVYYAAGSTLELQVARPPSDHATALRAAHELQAYCMDVDQECEGTVTGPHWSLWWD